MNEFELIAELTTTPGRQVRLPAGRQWRLLGPYSTDAENERFLRAIGRGLAAEGYSVRLERTTQTKADVPL